MKRNSGKPPLERILYFPTSHPWLVVITTLILTLFFAFFAVRVKVNPDVVSLIPENEKINTLIQKYSKGELTEESLVIAVESNDPFSPEILSAYAKTLARVESFSGIHPGITPFNITVFSKEGMKLGFSPAAASETLTFTEDDAAALKKRLTRAGYAKNLVISSDGTLLCAFFPVEPMDNYSPLMNQVDSAVAELKKTATTYVSGSIPFVVRTGSYISRDFIKLLGFALAIILVMYFLGFRSRRSVFLPTFVVITGTLWSIGFMSLLGFAITVISIITPPLVLTLGSSYSIHILNQYYREASEDNTSNNWIGSAVYHVNKTIILAGATTIIGIASLSITTIRQTKEFALATSFGIFVCVLLSLFFFPALLSLLRIPKKEHTLTVRSGLLSSGMKNLGTWVTKYRSWVVLAVFGIIVFFLLSINKLEYNTDTISYFPKKDSAVKDMYALTAKIGGFDELKLTLEAPEDEKNYFLNLDVLSGISAFEEDLLDIPDVSYESSFVTYLKNINNVMFGEYAVPEKRSLVLLLGRYLKAAGKNGDRVLSEIIEEDGSKMTISLRVYNSATKRYIDEKGLRNVVSAINEKISTSLPKEIHTELWGMSLRYLSLSRMIRKDMFKSMILSFLAVLFITTVAYRSFRFGLLSLIPLIIGILSNFIIMVIFSIPLDLLTIMVSSIVIGVGADDSIHFIIQFRKQLAVSRTIRETIEETLLITGRPIFLTTVSVVGGFSVLLFASFKPIVYFGLLVLAALLATCIGTLVFLPAILSFLFRKKDVEEM